MRELRFRAWVHGEMIYRDDPADIFGNYSNDIMQYTGLKDKNGKEIYEGDIIAEVGGYKYYIDRGQVAPTNLLNMTETINKRRNKVCSHGILYSKCDDTCFEDIVEKVVVGDKVWGVITRESRSGYEPFCDSTSNCGHCGGGSSPDKFVVVGNIYENPEMIPNLDLNPTEAT